MTNNPNILVDVCPYAPFTISLATSNGGHSRTNVCQCRGLLPLPLINGMMYYQTCFVNPYASETFILPQAIINSSGGSFDKWQMEGFLQGRPGILSLYSPSGIFKMSIKLRQQDGLYYSTTDMFTMETNPHSQCSPYVSSAFTDLTPDIHLIDKDDSLDYSGEYNDYISPVDPTAVDDDPATTTTTTADANVTPLCPPHAPTKPAPSGPYFRAPRLPRSWVLVHLTNLARQLESELWAACSGYCGKDQLIALANQADGLPNTFKFHPFQHIN
jgi:hypothetical protein